MCVCFVSEKRTVGMFWHNAAETWIDISSNTADKVGESPLWLQDMFPGSLAIFFSLSKWEGIYRFALSEWVKIFCVLRNAQNHYYNIHETIYK